MPFVSVSARIYVDATGAYEEIPVLVSPEGVVMPVMDYCLERHRSVSWMNKLVLVVTLFLEYWEANSHENFGPTLFNNFVKKLHSGTFNIETRIDPSCLCWLPRKTVYASGLIEMLSSFFDWLLKYNPEVDHPNPMVAGNSYDGRVAAIAKEFRRQHAFLGHLWNTEEIKTRRSDRRSSPTVPPPTPPRFPDQRFEELLLKGFKVGGNLDYRGILITLLLNKGGFRGSEPMHLWVEDVFPDPHASASAVVLIHHPSLGAAPSTWRYPDGRKRSGTRQEYLAEKFGLSPRTNLLGKKKAGWKNPLLDDNLLYMRSFWFEPEYAQWFMHFWLKYMQQLAGLTRNHPFAFVNLDQEPKGGIYTMAQYSKAHGAAVERIGLQVSKAQGTTPHGHRHAFGRRAKDAGLGEIEIQRMMHHRSPESQKTYIQPSLSEMHAEIARAYERLRLKGNEIQGLVPTSIFAISDSNKSNDKITP